MKPTAHPSVTGPRASLFPLYIITLLVGAALAMPRGAWALPDLVPEIFDVGVGVGDVDPGDVAEGCAGGPTGRTLLRYSLRTRNVGSSDVVLGDPGCPDCAQFPGAACANPLFICSTAHGHPHFEGFVRVELLDAGGSVVGQSHKVGFCLLDLECPTPRYSCGDQGISAGCSDVYDSSLPCQYIDLTGISLPSGSYTLRATVDPDGVFPESDEGNNTTSVPVEIGPGPQPSCPVFAAADVPQAIPDLGAATSTVQAPAGQPISRVRVVGLRAAHTYVRDLELHLRSPAGTDVLVMDRVCGDFDDVALDLGDGAATAIPCPPTDAGLHRPSQALSAFVGESQEGTWTLEVFDREAQDTGTLDAWGIEICGTCGNGVVDPGEVCDDGNTHDGDCCAADCLSQAPDGTSCSDGNACTADDTCAAGRCQPGGAVSCDPCLTCYSSLGCTPPATTVCEAAAPQASALSLRRPSGDPSRDRLDWTWKGRGVVLPGDFGLPETSTALHLCLFDAGGLRWSADVPPGGTCGNASCWKRAGTLRYRNAAASPDGIGRMTLAAGDPRRARIAAKGQGVRLALPPLDLSLPATMRLKRGDGSPICWQSTFATAKQKAPEAFTARSP